MRIQYNLTTNTSQVRQSPKFLEREWARSRRAGLFRAEPVSAMIWGLRKKQECVTMSLGILGFWKCPLIFMFGFYTWHTVKDNIVQVLMYWFEINICTQSDAMQTFTWSSWHDPLHQTETERCWPHSQMSQPAWTNPSLHLERTKESEQVRSTMQVSRMHFQACKRVHAAHLASWLWHKCRGGFQCRMWGEQPTSW